MTRPSASPCGQPQWYVIPSLKYGDVTILHSAIMGADWQAIYSHDEQVWDADSAYGKLQFLYYSFSGNEFISALTENDRRLNESERRELLEIFRKVKPVAVAAPKQLALL